MTTSEDEQIRAAILQLLAEYGDHGEIDFKNLPLLQQIIQQQVEQQLPVLTQERTQKLNELYAQKLNQNLQQAQSSTKKNLETLYKQQQQLQQSLVYLQKQRKNLHNQLDLDLKMARWTPIIIIIAVIALIITVLGLLYLTLPIILHGTGFAGIWHFAHPTFHNWGIVRGILAILGCFMLLILELAIILFPTTVLLHFLQVVYPKKPDYFNRDY